MNVLKEKLDTVERNKLRKLEAVVSEGLASFLTVGEALKEIRDAKLYRESHKTFEKYVDQKWGFKKSRAYQLIEACDVNANLSTIVDKNERASEIKNEGQLRELKDVPAESIEAVVNKAADIAGDNTITASDIKQAREEVLAEPDQQSAKPEDHWEDVPDEPEPTKPEPTAKERVSSLKSIIKQHNAAMMRAIDDLHWILPNELCHDMAHKSFRAIHEVVEAWR